MDKLHGLYGREIDEQLIKYLGKDVNEEFREAVIYQVSTGGKRLRPLITLTTAGPAVVITGLRYRLRLLWNSYTTTP